jgi:hypothetical protein
MANHELTELSTTTDVDCSCGWNGTELSTPFNVREETDDIFIECPACGDDGPHAFIDPSAAECRRCYTSIDLTDGA